jgi:hypothetical protein
MSINSVVISSRFETSSKTKRAAGSLKRPLRAVPRITGTKTGRVMDSISDFVVREERNLQSVVAGIDDPGNHSRSMFLVIDRPGSTIPATNGCAPNEQLGRVLKSAQLNGFSATA